MIDGVILTPLRQIFDERGKVMHMLREDSPIFTRFGEIYFSCTHPDVVKAWHMHKEMTLNYVCIEGRVKFVLYDDRKKSKTQGTIQELILTPKNYCLVTVPPLIWNGFKGEADRQSIVANCATLPHRNDEIIRKPALDKSIPYDWEK